MQEAKSHIVGRAAPGFDREQFRRQPRNVPGNSEQSAGSNSRGQQRLVRVTEGGVGDADGLLLTQCLRETFGSEFEQALTATGRRRRRKIDLGQLVLRVHRRGTLTVRLVDSHIREVGQDLRAAVCRRTQSQQLRTFLDEGGRHASGTEVRVVENRLQERNVGRDATNAELGDRAASSRHSGFEVATATSEFDQHGIEVRSDLGAECGATVQADTGSARGAVRGDTAGVRAESVCRILGRDAALQRRAAKLDRLL